MQHATEGRLRWTGLASAVAGGLLVPYALLKGPVSSAVVADGWRPGGLAPETTALLVHLAEELPLLVVAAGLLALHRQLDARSRLARLGIAVALLGFALTITLHLGEHLVPPVTVQTPVGETKVLVYGYYAGWVVLLAGLGGYGLGLRARETGPGWLATGLVGLGPTALGVAATVSLLDVFTVAGTLRVALGLAWVVIGTWLWTTGARESATTVGSSVSGPRTDERGR